MKQHLIHAQSVYRALRAGHPTGPIHADVWLHGGHYFNALRINHFFGDELLMTQGETPVHIEVEAIVAMIVQR